MEDSPIPRDNNDTSLAPDQIEQPQGLAIPEAHEQPQEDKLAAQAAINGISRYAVVPRRRHSNHGGFVRHPQDY